jgi:hypothetical protein
MKIVVADRYGVFTFDAADADREIIYIGDSAFLCDPEEVEKVEEAMDREIQYVTVAGKDIPAEQIVCPTCHALDLATTVDLGNKTARCSQGHQWIIYLPEVA